MNEKNPLDKALDELNNVLLILQKNKGKPIIQSEVPPEVLEKLEKIEEDVAKLRKQTVLQEAEVNLDRKKLNRALKNFPDDVEIPELQRLKRAAELKAAIHDLHALYTTEEAKEAPAKSMAAKTEEDAKKLAKQRANKFRSLGGKKNWKML